MSADKLPEDYGVNAYSDEAIRRGTSYGKLVAATSLEEREQIKEDYRKRKHRNRQTFRSTKIHTSKNGGHK